MSTKENKKYFAVGAIALALVAVLIVALCTVFTPGYFRPKTMIETYFTESVNGLSVGSPVKFHGVEIGEVKEILLSSEAYPKSNINLFSPHESVAVVRMLVNLDPDKLSAQSAKIIEEGARIQTELSGLTGTLYLSINFLNPRLYEPEVQKFSWTPKYTYIPSAISLTNEIVANIEDFFATLDSVKGDLGEGLPGPQDIRKTLLSLEEAAKAINPEKVSTLLNEAEHNVQSANEALTAVQVGRFNALLKDLTESAKTLNVRLNSKETAKLVDDLNSTAASFNRMIASNRYDIASLMRSLRTATASLASLTQSLARSGNLFPLREKDASPFK